MLNFPKKYKNLAVRILFVSNSLLRFSFLVQKSIFILGFCIDFLLFLIKKGLTN